MKAKISIAEQLALLKDQTQHWNLLFEPQVTQLRLWGKIIFSTAASYEVYVDLERKRVRYILQGDVPQEINLLEGLGRSIRSLLGDNFDLEVKASTWTWSEDGNGEWEIKRKRTTDSQSSSKSKSQQRRIAIQSKKP